MTEDWDDEAERARARRVLGIVAAVVLVAGCVLLMLIVLLVNTAEKEPCTTAEPMEDLEECP